MAAVLACGDGAVLSHHAAAHLLRLMRRGPPPPEVTVPTLAGRRRPGIVIHRVRTLHHLDTSTFEGIPIATVPRVLLDLAPRTRPRSSRGCATRPGCTTRPGRARSRPASPATRTRRESRSCAARCSPTPPSASWRTDSSRCSTGTRLACPRTNIDHNGDKVDCHWPGHDLTVELLSFRFHGTRAGVRGRRRAAPALRAPCVHLRRRLRTAGTDDRRAAQALRG